MLAHSFATGHGDTLDDLLKELSWQVNGMRWDKRCRDLLQRVKDELYLGCELRIEGCDGSHCPGALCCEIRKALAALAPPYPFCRTPQQCAGKGYCTKEIACNE